MENGVGWAIVTALVLRVHCASSNPLKSRIRNIMGNSLSHWCCKVGK